MLRDPLAVWPVLVSSGMICGYLANRLCARASWAWYIIVAAGIVLFAIWAGTIFRGSLFALSCLLASALVMLGTIDLRTLRLPDVLTLPLIILGLAVTIWRPQIPLLDRFAGGVLGYGLFAGLAFLYRQRTGRDGLGLGDAKLVAAAGTWLGCLALPSVILIASIATLIFASLQAMRGMSLWNKPLPFGPALAAAFWLVWLYGPIWL